MDREFDDGLKKLAKAFAVLAVRNSFLEDLHSGKVPDTTTGDYTDVKIITPTQEIPWNELSRLNNAEMKRLMKEVVDKLYTCLSVMHDVDNRKEFESLIRTGTQFSSEWDDPENDITVRRTQIANGESNPNRKS